jgi:MobA/VirD2-like, nuclease domain
MIVENMSAGSTKGTILYVAQKDDAELIIANDVVGTPEQMVKQFRQVQELNTRALEKNKTYHSAISLHPKDKGKLSKSDEIKIIKDYAKMMKLDKNQFVCYKHSDTKNPHYHFVANRINEDTQKSTSLSNNRYKYREFCKGQEKKYNLVVALKNENKVTFKDEVEKDNKIEIKEKFYFKEDNSQIENLRKIVERELAKSKSLKELTERLAQGRKILDENNKVKFIDKVEVLKKGGGIAFMKIEKPQTQQKKESKRVLIFKGSKLGREFSLKGIEKQISNENKKDKIAIAFEVHQGKYAGKISNISYNPTHLNKALKEKFGFKLSKDEILKVQQLSKELNKGKNKGMKM